jgi:hypothetical protein
LTWDIFVACVPAALDVAASPGEFAQRSMVLSAHGGEFNLDIESPSSPRHWMRGRPSGVDLSILSPSIGSGVDADAVFRTPQHDRMSGQMRGYRPVGASNGRIRGVPSGGGMSLGLSPRGAGRSPSSLAPSLSSPMVARGSMAEELRQAAAEGDTAVVRRLIAFGAEVNERSEFGCAPIHYAAFYGRVEVVRTLLALHADANAQCCDGSTPCMTHRRAGMRS